MDLPIRVKAFDEHGITLVPPTSADFDALARPLIGRVADIGLKLKPMLMIVSNESPHTIVSYSKTWTVRHADGRTTVLRSHASFPETVCGDILIARDPEAFAPGAKRVETASMVIQAYAQDNPYYDQFLRPVHCRERSDAHERQSCRSSWIPSYSPMAASLETIRPVGWATSFPIASHKNKPGIARF